MSQILPAELVEAAESLLACCRGANLRLATAESCTGGLIAACLTEIAGSSDVFERGFVTYSNDSKTEALGVPASLIAEHGAVSDPVARAMAAGVLEHSPADIAVAVTGVAGPSGGTADKPVGLVYLAVARRGGPVHVEKHRFDGDRGAVRLATVRMALALAFKFAAV